MHQIIASGLTTIFSLIIGAVNAMQDAVILANCLYDLKDNTQKSITAAFKSYYDQRYVVSA